MAFTPVWGVDRFGCTAFPPILLSVKTHCALLHSEYEMFGWEVWDLGHTHILIHDSFLKVRYPWCDLEREDESKWRRGIGSSSSSSRFRLMYETNEKHTQALIGLLFLKDNVRNRSQKVIRRDKNMKWHTTTKKIVTTHSNKTAKKTTTWNPHETAHPVKQNRSTTSLGN